MREQTPSVSCPIEKVVPLPPFVGQETQAEQ